MLAIIHGLERSLTVFVGIFCLLSSCSGEESPQKPPAYVLSSDSFASLLVDLALAESATAINILNVRGHQIDSTYAFDPLKEHSLSPARYDSTIAYYTRNPEQYKEVYQKALTALSALETARRTVKQDSLKAGKTVE